MSIKSVITDLRTANTAGVGADGRVFTGPPGFSSAFNATLGTDDAVVNVVEAKAGHKFVVTDVFAKANKNVSATVDATVEIYEADSATSATVQTALLNIPLARSESVTLNGIFLGTKGTVYINARTDDDDVFITILGYYTAL
jgi:hypothetical protein